jgi:hypothetical protein
MEPQAPALGTLPRERGDSMLRLWLAHGKESPPGTRIQHGGVNLAASRDFRPELLRDHSFVPGTHALARHYVTALLSMPASRGTISLFFN